MCLCAPQRDAGAHALDESDHKEAEHDQNDQHFEQSETAHRPAIAPLFYRQHHPPAPPLPSRSVFSTTDRSPPRPGHKIATSTSNKVVVAEEMPSCASVCRVVTGCTRSLH